MFQNQHIYSLSSSQETDSDFRAKKVTGWVLLKSPLTTDLKTMLLISILVLTGITEQPRSKMHPTYWT